MTDKPTLECLLASSNEALWSIQKSLGILADLQLAAEFEPDHVVREGVYERMDKAKHADHLASVEIQTLVDSKKLNAATDIAQPLAEAMNVRQKTQADISELTKLFPAMGRLSAHRVAKEEAI